MCGTRPSIEPAWSGLKEDVIYPVDIVSVLWVDGAPIEIGRNSNIGFLGAVSQSEI